MPASRHLREYDAGRFIRGIFDPDFCDAVDACYKEGAGAYADGRPRTDNPYTFCIYRDAWNDGWDAAGQAGE